MFVYGPESYDFQTWSAAGDGEYLLDNDTPATNLLSHKLVHMADGVGPDDPSPIRAASPAGLASSAVPHSPAHSPSRSCSRTPIHETEKKGPALAPRPAPTPRRPNPSPQSPQMVKADSDSRAQDDSKSSDSNGSDKEGPGGGGKITDGDGQDEDSDGKLMNPAVQLKSQMLKAAPALQIQMMKLTKATLPAKT